MENNDKIKLNHKEKEILKEYVQYGDNHCLDDITTKNVIDALHITKIEAKRLKQSDEYKQIKEIKEKFTKEREFGFYEKSEKKLKKVVIEWAKTQSNLKSLSETEIWNKYQNKEFGFGSFTKFYDWFMKQLKKQGDKCYYCKTHKSDLERTFRVKGEPKEKQIQKPLYSTKFSAAFHIDRKIPKEPYSNTDNCVLACAFCNNMKSDMVKDADFFKDFFGEMIYSFQNTLRGDFVDYEIDE